MIIEFPHRMVTEEDIVYRAGEFYRRSRRALLRFILAAIAAALLILGFLLHG